MSRPPWPDLSGQVVDGVRILKWPRLTGLGATLVALAMAVLLLYLSRLIELMSPVAMALDGGLWRCAEPTTLTPCMGAGSLVR